MKNKKSGMGLIIYSVVSVILVAVFVAAFIVTNIYSSIISTYLGQATTKRIQDENDTTDTQYYKSEYLSESAMRKAGESLCEDIVEEGAVLMKNADIGRTSALPLAENERKVNFFSITSFDFIYGGTGSGSVSTSTALKLNDVFTSAGYGFTYNSTLWNFYVRNQVTYMRGQMTVFDDVLRGEWQINDCDPVNFTSAVKNSLTSVGKDDIAITVIGRQGAEGGDLPDYDYSENTVKEGNEHFLQLNNNEKALLKYVGGLNVAKNIVIVNSANALELGWINDPEYNIDAVLWLPSSGQTGLKALPKILVGDVNPSGSLMDTWAYNALSSPAAQNSANHSFTNASEFNMESTYDKYVVYQEGIYVGYKYYETRYYDSVISSGNASSSSGASFGANSWDYDKEVLYPFGYGLSYTDFALDNFTMKKNGDDYTLSVDVTNVGKVAGKAAVQFYLSAPYDKASGVERAAVELVDFDKTEILDSGKTETLTVTVAGESLKTYDYKNEKGYIIQGGDYYFTAAFDAHEATNNVLAAKEGKTDLGDAGLAVKDTLSADTQKYSTSTQTGYEVTNRLDYADLNNYDGYNITYLSRSDWQNTFPTEQKLKITQEIVDKQKMLTVDDISEDNAKMPKTDGSAAVNAVMLKGKDYDDDMWEDLLDKMTFDEMSELIRMGGYKVAAVPSLVLDIIGEQDGPAGISATLVGGGTKCMAYPSEIVLGATFNKELVYRFGKLVGEDALYATTSTTNRRIGGWYAPSVNIHRSPFSGRNFEYFSEDSVVNGLMAVETIKGASEKGLICTMKHYAVNDQETNRVGVNTWVNEQAVREIYLKPFEIAVTNSPCCAIMSSMNRIGPVWAGSSREMLTDILRDEWGFRGRVISDYNGANVYATYQSIWGALYAGNDQMLNTNALLYDLSSAKNNATAVTLMRNACHNILYSVVNGSGMNGISEKTVVVKIMPTWQILLVVAACVVGVAIVAVGVLLTLKYRKIKNAD